MDKDELLKVLEGMSAQKAVTREEVLAAFEKGRKDPEGETGLSQAGVSQLLYFVGGGIVFIGISILVGQHWRYLGSFVRILLTLGVGLGFFWSAVLAWHDQRTRRLAQAFFFMAGLLLPVGIGVTFDAAGFSLSRLGGQSLIAGIVFAGFLVSYLTYRETVLLVFSIAFGSWLYLAGTGLLLESSPLSSNWRFECYRTLAVFVTYLCLGYHYDQDRQRPGLAGWLLGLGSCGFLSATLVLGGWKPGQSVFWELVYPFIAFGFLYWSIMLRSRAVLFFGAAFLIAYIGKITGEYFANSIGWPLALVVLGIAIILIGYWAVYLKNKYFQK